MPVSVSVVSFAPTPFIPALASLRGRSAAIDFTSQLEGLKAALAATLPDDPGPAPVTEKSDPGAAMSGNRKRDASRPASASGTGTPGTKDNAPEGSGAPSAAIQDIVRSLADRGTGQGTPSLPDEITSAPAQGPAMPPTDSAISITRTNQADPQAPLSFAARIQAPVSQSDLPQDTQSQDTQSQDTQSQGEGSDSTQSFGAVAAVVKKVPQSEPAADAGASAAPVVPAPGSALNSAGTLSSAINSAAITSAVQAPAVQPQSVPHDNIQPLAAAKEPEFQAPSQPPSSTPLKDLSFNITQPGGSSVQLHMMERSGELRVAVHASSPELSQALRADLPDLTRKLSDTGSHSEVWRPDTHSTAASSDASASRNQGGSGNHPSDKQGGNSANSQSQSGGSQQGRSQGRQNQFQRPKWVEELENGMHSATKSTGETYGIRS